MQQAKELGLSPKGFAFSVGPGTPDFQTALQNDANYVMGGVQWTPALKYNGYKIALLEVAAKRALLLAGGAA